MIVGEPITVTVYHPQNRSIVLCAFLSILAFMTIAVDFCEAIFHHSPFYISESLLFSSFWVLSFPLLRGQAYFINIEASVYQRLLLTGLLILIHLVSFPAVVWLLSAVFYNHTFSYRQTLEFGITTHFIKAILLYTLPLFCYQLWKQKETTPAVTAAKGEVKSPAFLTSLTVPDTNNRKVLIEAKDILYFSSASPYVHIHHINKKYLHTETLKSLLLQLDPEQFVRIHKSAVVNVFFVAAYQSRLNGDYDLTLKDGTVLRLSRNYAVAFKSLFGQVIGLPYNILSLAHPGWKAAVQGGSFAAK